jgi:hypothetical protein
LESGIYLFYKENFFSDKAQTKAVFTARALGDFIIINTGKKKYGINAKGGIFLPGIDANGYKSNSGFIFGGAFFIKDKEGAIARFGFEEQINNVSHHFPAEGSYKALTYDYKLKRFGLYISIFIPLNYIGDQ